MKAEHKALILEGLIILVVFSGFVFPEWFLPAFVSAVIFGMVYFLYQLLVEAFKAGE